MRCFECASLLLFISLLLEASSQLYKMLLVRFFTSLYFYPFTKSFTKSFSSSNIIIYSWLIPWTLIVMMKPHKKVQTMSIRVNVLNSGVFGGNIFSSEPTVYISIYYYIFLVSPLYILLVSKKKLHKLDKEGY